MASMMQRMSPLRWAIILLILVVVLGVGGYFSDHLSFAVIGSQKQNVNEAHNSDGNEVGHMLSLPSILLETGIYQNDSFQNGAGVVPAYWEGERDNSTVANPGDVYGPCYSYNADVDWEAAIARYNNTQEPWYNEERESRENPMDLQGYCRPGFLIIGAGKCGTSSLYHYVSSHPNVLPASQKQIHYFKYHKFEPLKWYYSHFPSTDSMLSAGALMSGEASPGYLPYPEVVIDMKRGMPEPRLLAIGRNPIERAFSSYKYNYVVPTLERLRKGKLPNIDKHQTEEEYQQYLCSFEDMMRAELAVLEECFAPGSKPEHDARHKWGKVPFINKEYKRRKDEGLPPLIDLDGFCYGSKVNNTVLRKQWADLVAEQPDKIILNSNLHLTQAFIGRSLYVFPLEWWYAAFPSEHIYFVCTEELEDMSGESMNSVGSFLGLPRYDNFSAVVQGGAYNVGGHRGYDNEIPWSELQNTTTQVDIPLSAEFRQELEEFIRPYNERLFSLTGRRCDW